MSLRNVITKLVARRKRPFTSAQIFDSVQKHFSKTGQQIPARNTVTARLAELTNDGVLQVSDVTQSGMNLYVRSGTASTASTSN